MATRRSASIAASAATSGQRIYFVSLGCPKNQVDTELMLGQVQAAGHALVDAPESADVIVVNTCAFIDAAKEESVDTILEMAQHKQRGAQKLVVTGCLAQRYADDLQQALPEVDVFVGTGDLLRIADAVEAPLADAPVVYRGAQHVLPPHGVAARVRTGAWWTAYLKVSEGCDHACGFCAIPQLRGKLRSRKIESCVAEARQLALEVRPASGAQVQTLFGEIYAAPPEVVALAAEMIKESR